MLILKFLLIVFGLGSVARGVATIAADLVRGARRRRLEIGGLGLPGQEPAVLRWRLALRHAATGVVPLLLGLSLVVVPSGRAGVRVRAVRA